jgi:hypothetical protein
MQRILSFEQTPPFSVPLRFFLTAPVFAIVAGGLLLWHGPQALVSRWSPITLALTHLLTLGFLTMSMIGALLQLLPVVAGVDVPRVRLTAGVVHVLLALGTAALAAAFLSSAATMFQIALGALLMAFAWLLGACWYGLRRVESGSATLTAMRLSLLALGLAAGLGLAAASAFAWRLALPVMQLVDLHAAWGLLGWVGLLIIGVAYQVVPMFQVTPMYPRRFAQGLAVGLFLLLCGWTATMSILPNTRYWPSTAPAILVGAGYAAFSITTLYLLWRRKRPKPEATTLFWFVGLISILGCVGLWLAAQLLPRVAAAPSYPLALGTLFIIGFGYSVINGMLYKIVPFLVWYHLQNQLAGGCKKAPNVKQIVPDRVAERQFYAHLAALVLLVAAAVWPNQFARPAAAAFIVSSCWLSLNLLNAARIYRDRLTHDAKHDNGAAIAA